MRVNPCPCGYYGDPARPCTCSQGLVARYQHRISGPLMDRIDLFVEVPRVDYEKLMVSPPRDWGQGLGTGHWGLGAAAGSHGARPSGSGLTSGPRDHPAVAQCSITTINIGGLSTLE
ncbi:MAG: ATP-binding protein [Chloroflexi bacterium]|nr:ATP-binding protein [Chloroflexota bacterium]